MFRTSLAFQTKFFMFRIRKPLTFWLHYIKLAGSLIRFYVLFLSHSISMAQKDDRLRNTWIDDNVCDVIEGKEN